MQQQCRDDMSSKRCSQHQGDADQLIGARIRCRFLWWDFCWMCPYLIGIDWHIGGCVQSFVGSEADQSCQPGSLLRRTPHAKNLNIPNHSYIATEGFPWLYFRFTSGYNVCELGVVRGHQCIGAGACESGVAAVMSPAAACPQTTAAGRSVHPRRAGADARRRWVARGTLRHSLGDLQPKRNRPSAWQCAMPSNRPADAFATLTHGESTHASSCRTLPCLRKA